MRYTSARLGFLPSLLIASAASAVTMAWTPVGNPGNACEVQIGGFGFSGGCFGNVGYAYHIGTYEVTNAQYTEFLNAKAASDPLGLYDPNMGDPAQTATGYGGIARSGSAGSYTYSAIAGRENMPVNWVSFYDSLRFANWMNNGQGNGDTEGGAYTLLGGTASPTNGASVTRNAGAKIVLTNEDEWYKAAYYDAASHSYFDFPNSPILFPICTAPTTAPNSANCDAFPPGDDPTDVDVDDLTPVGSFPGSPSPYRTHDQGGNVSEWNEATSSGTDSRGLRGGNFQGARDTLGSHYRLSGHPQLVDYRIGFRVALIPEPGTGLLVIAGLLALGGWRRGLARYS